MACCVSPTDEEIKRIITGLLTSLTHKCTIKQLSNDFINTVGYPIPFKSLGFNNVAAYLKSIPDTVRVTGEGSSALVEVIIQPKSAHIDQLVSKQRAPKNCPPRLKQRRKPLTLPRRTQLSYSDNARCTITTTTTTTTVIGHDNILTNHDNNITNHDNNVINHDNNVINHDNNITNHDNNVINRDNNVTSRDNNVSIPDNHTTLATELYSYKSNVPYEIQNNLRKLIKDFTNGIWCTEIPEEYRRKFRKNLSFERYRYKSLIEMISDLPEIFHFIQPTSDDYLIFDKNTPLPNIDEYNRSIDENYKDDQPDEDGLPKIDWVTLKSLIPSDIVPLSEIIPRYVIDKKVNDYFDISIGEIYDLSKFWSYLTFGPLESLMKDLQEFFNNQKNKYHVPEYLLEEGLYIVTLYEKQFHRAVIINLLTHNPKQVKVLFIDYGTVWRVNITDIWYLPKKFSKIPCQAIRTRLSNIEPTTKCTPWRIDAINRFRELITNRDLVAEITKIDTDDQIIEIYLADITDSENIFYINDVLVKEGCACYKGQAIPPTLKYTKTIDSIHLYPEFCEIEAGYAPNCQDFNYILQNGITIDQYLPQYFARDIKDDIEYLDSAHDEYKKNFKLLPFDKKKVIQKNFDFSLFPIDMYNDIREIYNETFKKSNNDTKQKRNNNGNDGGNNNKSTDEQQQLDGSRYRKRIINKIFKDESNRNDRTIQQETLPMNCFNQINRNPLQSTIINPSVMIGSNPNQNSNNINNYPMLSLQNRLQDLTLDISTLNPNNPFLPDILQARMMHGPPQQHPFFR